MTLGIRRPVACTQRWDRRDSQQDLPWRWCARCGMEVWDMEQTLCSSCLRWQEKD